MAKRTLVIAALTLIAVVAFAGSEGREPAPRFSAKTLSGEKFNNDSVKGKVVLLQFWTTWCPYCRKDQPVVDELEREFADKGLLVLAVNVGESKKKVQKYLQENPRSCRIVLMDDTNLAAIYATRQFPVYVLIDREGNIAGTQKGGGNERALRRLVGRAGLESEE